jgi:hypothetical protein
LAVAFVVAMALLLALAARAAAADDPGLDDQLDDGVEPEQLELVAQPDTIDEPAADESIAQLESLGIAGTAGVEDWLEQQARHQRPSPWGRIDFEIAWLHRDDAPGIDAPHTFDELWIELVWRR